MSQGRLSTQLAEMQRLHRAGFASKSAGMLTSRTTDGIIRKPAWRPASKLNRRFPFQVYKSPSGNTEGQTDGWRKFLVRSGRVGVTEATGTDGADFPDSSTPGETTNEFVVDDNKAKWVVWVSYAPGETPTATIENAEVIGGAVDGWPGYPGPCTTEGFVCILLAEIDTATNSSSKTALVRQLVRTDLPDFYQACVLVGGNEKVINVACDGQPFSFVA